MAQISEKVRTRFAPSPTGFIHIGNFRTALFAYLFAKHNNGVFVLRVEDTDQNRKVEGAINVLLKTMQTMGVVADEGYYLSEKNKVEDRGNFGPYLQSERLDLYQKHIQDLVEKGSAYYCFCSEQRLEDLRKEQTALKKPPMYDKLCRGLSTTEIAAKQEDFVANGTRPVVRFAIPPEGVTTVQDLIFGNVEYENKLLDDQVILKSDGFPTYHLAVVVDDHYMQITHVIRGDEWIPSTPKHLLLYKAFGWEPPAFAHVPLILNPDKTKLSKRQGDVGVEDYLNKGYLPEALINFVAFLGWNPKTEQEIFSLAELVAEFDLNKVNKSPAVFDINKLDWINSKYIREKSNSELAELLMPYWVDAGLIKQDEKLAKEFLEDIAGLEKERLKKLSEIGERTGYFFAEPAFNPELLAWKKSTLADARIKLSRVKDLLSTIPDETFANAKLLQDALMAYITEQGFDVGAVLWPLRVALTGQQFSPGPAEVASTIFVGLGKEEIISRIDKAISL